MEKEIKYYILLKNGDKKYFDWTYYGFREAQKYVYDNPDDVQIDNNGNYTLYTDEI